MQSVPLSQSDAVLCEQSINPVYYIPSCESTNQWAKAHFEQFGPVGAVYTTNQTAGRGRLGRVWENAAGNGLYYTVAIAEPLVQPSTLPLLASLLVCEQLKARYGISCTVKWPNDILLNGKKICGILCESISYGTDYQGRGIVCGIGINLAQPASYFAQNNLPYATSLVAQGIAVDLQNDPLWFATQLTSFGFDRQLYAFARVGFAPYLEQYQQVCANLNKQVYFTNPDGTQGTGIVSAIDQNGNLVVQTEQGVSKVFTGEVSVKGIYGAAE